MAIKPGDTFTSTRAIPNGLIDTQYADDKVGFLHIENLTPYMASAYKQRMSGQEGWTKDREMQKVASLPPLVAHRLEKIGILNDDVALKVWLKSEEGARYRTTTGGI